MTRKRPIDLSKEGKRLVDSVRPDIQWAIDAVKSGIFDDKKVIKSKKRLGKS